MVDISNTESDVDIRNSVLNHIDGYFVENNKCYFCPRIMKDSYFNYQNREDSIYHKDIDDVFTGDFATRNEPDLFQKAFMEAIFPSNTEIEPVCIKSVDLFRDLDSGASLKCLDKVFAHSHFMETNQNVDNFIEINKLLDFNDEKNKELFNSLDKDIQDKVHMLNGVQSMIYQFGNGGIEQYFFNNYDKPCEIDNYVGEFCLPQIIENYDCFISAMKNLGFNNCANSFADMLHEINNYQLVENLEDLDRDAQIDLISEKLDDWSNEDIADIMDPSIYIDPENLQSEDPEHYQDIIDHLGIGTTPYTEIVSVYGSLDCAPEYIQELMDEEIDGIARGDVAKEVVDQGLLYNFDLSDFETIATSPFMNKETGELVSGWEVDQNCNLLYDIEPALTYTIEQESKALVDAYNKHLSDPMSRGQKWEKVSEHTYVNNKKESILSSIKPDKPALSGALVQDAR